MARKQYFVIDRITPENLIKSVIVKTKREAGQHVAYCLHYNAGVDRKTVTRYGMEFERTGELSTHGYRFDMRTSPTPDIREYEEMYRYAAS